MRTSHRPGRFTVPRRRGTFASARRWTIPAIGALTPVGLIVVNIAAFIVNHLQEFRLGISVLAFVSSVMLNCWTALKVYRIAKARWPHHGLLDDSNQELVLVGSLLIIIIISFVEALFCYQGLSSQKDLPNAATFYLGVVAIAIPILLQAVFARLGSHRTTGIEAYPAPPPAPADRWKPQ